MSESRATRIVLIDDHQLFSASLSSALVAEGYEVTVPELTTIDALRSLLTISPADVALIDLDLGAMGSGEEILESLVKSGTSVLVVSGTRNEATIGRCLESGASGWVPKSAPFEELLRTVLDLAAGQDVLSAQERQRMLAAWQGQRATSDALTNSLDRLTSRESQVLAMLVDGQSVSRIAEASFVSEATVRTQVRAILQKLGVNSQLEAVALAGRSPRFLHADDDR